MRAKIKVDDLTLAQWDWLQTNLEYDYQMAPETVRVCVEFELTPDLSSVHVELPVRVFMHLMNQLQRIGIQAALTPDSLPDHLNKVRDEADPARTRSAALLEEVSEFPSMESPGK